MGSRSIVVEQKLPHRKPEAKLSVGEIKAAHTLMPWSCHHATNHSEITAYSEASGAWEIIAEIKESAGVDAEKAAEFITQVVNEYDQTKDLIRQLTVALETCLSCEHLTWEAEHEADVVLRRAKEINR